MLRRWLSWPFRVPGCYHHGGRPSCSLSLWGWRRGWDGDVFVPSRPPCRLQGAGCGPRHNPLEPGRYLVVNGGSNSSTNAHLETLDASVPRYRAWRGQSYGVDLVAVDGFGLRARGVQPADPRAYVIYGARVLSPCAGEVVIAVHGLPDMRVPEVDSDHLAGNHVMLRCAEADVLLGHLQRGSVRVRAGERVAVGDWLGLVGNSGNTGEPHLHVHAQGRGTTEAPLSGDPRPIQFTGRFPVRGDRIEVR